MFCPPTSPVALAPNFSGTGGERLPAFSVKRQIFFNPRYIGRIEDRGFSELALTLRTFGRQQVSTTRLTTQYFAGRRNLKALGHRFLRFASRYRFWHKESGTYTLDSS
jgi:hypothetical protein